MDQAMRTNGLMWTLLATMLGTACSGPDTVGIESPLEEDATETNVTISSLDPNDAATSGNLEPGAGQGDSPAADAARDGVAAVSGSWRVAAFVAECFTERVAALTDLSAFVARDSARLLDDEQFIAPLVVAEGGREQFELRLPATPGATEHRFGSSSAGVQLFAVNIALNVVGDPFVGPFDMTGWASELTSIRAAHGTREVVGGRLVVWVEEPAEFPSGFGADDLLFTADDPLAPLASGWTVVDLDQAPFARLRDARVETPIDNGDVSKDLTQGTYTEAFDALTRELEQRYPYTDLKGLDWNAIVGEVRPRVVSAEQAGDAVAFDEALMRLSVLMGDGHAAVLPPSFTGVIESYGGGVGLRLELPHPA